MVRLKRGGRRLGEMARWLQYEWFQLPAGVFPARSPTSETSDTDSARLDMILLNTDCQLTAIEASRRRARQIGLKYVESNDPGYTRRRLGRGFSYCYANGKVVRSKAVRQRIEKLAIPPAWTEVWICRSAKGHIQATGRDDRNRKQYIYHPKWQEESNELKFDGLLHFGELLPKLRRTISRHANARAPKYARRKLLARMVQLLDQSAIRIGNEEYVLANGSYGLTTLLKQHVSIKGATITLEFTGKGGLEQEVKVADPSLARFLRRCSAGDCQRLFTSIDDGAPRNVEAADLNQYLAEISNNGVTAKDFRTWRASVVAAEHLAQCDDDLKPSQRKKQALAAIDAAAEALGNTRSVSRKYYVHPQLIEAFEEGRFAQLMSGFRARRRQRFSAAEQRLLHLLRSLSSGEN